MEIFDSHCHLDVSAYDQDRQEVLQRAIAAGVTRMLIPAIIATDWDKLLMLCEDSPNMFPALGIHPMFTSGHGEEQLNQLEGLLATGRAKAVGECGLDYFIREPNKKHQEFLFESQLFLAEKYHLPLVIHSRRAEEAAILMVRQHTCLSGVFHSFSGSYEQACRLIDLDFKLGFGGPVTYARATRLRNLFSRLPLEAIVLETDAPYQSDTNWRGKRNEPARLANILAELSQLRNESQQQIAEITTHNSIQLFCT